MGKVAIPTKTFTEDNFRDSCCYNMLYQLRKLQFGTSKRLHGFEEHRVAGTELIHQFLNYCYSGNLHEPLAPCGATQTIPLGCFEFDLFRFFPNTLSMRLRSRKSYPESSTRVLSTLSG